MALDTRTFIRMKFASTYGTGINDIINAQAMIQLVSYMYS
jgi:hypothetical protein